MPQKLKEFPKEVLIRYLSGESPNKLASEFNTSDNTIRSFLRRNGVKTRSLSEAQSIYPNKGKRLKENTKKLISLSKIGKSIKKPEGFGQKISKALKGIKKTKEHCENLSKGQIKRFSNGKHPSYKDGITEFIKRLRCTKKYIDWRTSIFRRDNYLCATCSKKGNLQVHHKTKLVKLIRKYQIKNTTDAYLCEPLWEMDLEITVCKICHEKLEKEA